MRVKFWLLYFFLSTVSLVGSQGGYWSLAHLHVAEGRVHPWMSHQLIARSYLGICYLDNALKVSWHPSYLCWCTRWSDFILCRYFSLPPHCSKTLGCSACSYSSQLSFCGLPVSLIITPCSRLIYYSHTGAHPLIDVQTQLIYLIIWFYTENCNFPQKHAFQHAVNYVKCESFFRVPPTFQVNCAYMGPHCCGSTFSLEAIISPALLEELQAFQGWIRNVIPWECPGSAIEPSGWTPHKANEKEASWSNAQKTFIFYNVI